MKVLIYHHTLFELSETFVYNQVLALCNRFEVVLLTHRRKNEINFPLPREVKVVVVNDLPIGLLDKISHSIKVRIHGSRFLLPPSAENKIENLIDEQNIEIVHVHFGNSALKILPIAEKTGVKLLASFHGYDASRLLNLKEYTKRLPRLFSFGKKFICCAEMMIKRLEAFGLDSSKAVCVHYGIDGSKIAASKSEEKQRDFTFIHAGRVTEKKGVPDLIEAYHLFLKNGGKAKLKIIGDGEDYDKSVSLVKKLKLEDEVKFFGSQGHSDLLRQLSMSDVFILNSRIDYLGNSEGFPNAILEAMGSGLPVISTYHAGIPEIIENNVNGLLVKEKDTNALGEAMFDLWENNEKRESIKSAALLNFNHKYNLDLMAKKIIAAIESA